MESSFSQTYRINRRGSAQGHRNETRNLDGKKVGHFLITIQKSFNLNQLLTRHGYKMAILTKTDVSSSFSPGTVFIYFFSKVSISLGKLCLNLTKCVTIKNSFNEIIWLSLQ